MLKQKYIKIALFIFTGTVGLMALQSCKREKMFRCGTMPMENTTCPAKLYLPLDGNTSDKSIYTNPVIEHGSFASGEDRTGKANGAVFFNGTDNYLEIPHNPQFAGKHITIMAWIKPTAFNFYTNGVVPMDDYSGIFNKWDDASRTGLSAYCTYKQMRVNGQFANNVFYDFGSVKGSLLKLNEWQHIAYKIDNGTIRLYLNGNIIANTFTGNTEALLTVLAHIEIGRTKWYPSYTLMLSYFTGYMDDLKVYYDCPDISVSQEMFMMY